MTLISRSRDLAASPDQRYAKARRPIMNNDSVVHAPNSSLSLHATLRPSEKPEKRRDGSIYSRFFRFGLGALLLFGSCEARAQISMRPEALTHYSFCISHAKDRNNVFLLDRGTMYRCGDEIAVGYFNYLGRQRVPEKRVTEQEGVFIYRMITGVGKCWNKIEDAEGNPMSLYGCDIYVEL